MYLGIFSNKLHYLFMLQEAVSFRGGGEIQARFCCTTIQITKSIFKSHSAPNWKSVIQNQDICFLILDDWEWHNFDQVIFQSLVPQCLFKSSHWKQKSSLIRSSLGIKGRKPGVAQTSCGEIGGYIKSPKFCRKCLNDNSSKACAYQNAATLLSSSSSVLLLQ